MKILSVSKERKRMNINHVKDCICNQVKYNSDYAWACCWGEVSSDTYYDSYNDSWSIDAVYGLLLDGRTIVNVLAVEYDEEHVISGDCSVEEVRKQALSLVEDLVEDLGTGFVLYANLGTLDDIASKHGKILSDDGRYSLEKALSSYAACNSVTDLREAYEMMVSEGVNPLDSLDEYAFFE
jgi:hypothetical protein